MRISTKSIIAFIVTILAVVIAVVYVAPWVQKTFPPPS